MLLGEWKVNDVKPSPTGEAQEVKVKVRINTNGVVLISSAQMIEKSNGMEENGANENEPQSPTELAPGQEAAPQPAGDPMETQDVSSFHFFVSFVATIFSVTSFWSLKNVLPPCNFTVMPSCV